MNKENLTWEDVRKIVNIADKMIDLDVMDELPECCESEEGYYTEILNRFFNRETSGIEQIRCERQKQIDKYGYTPSHDSAYKHGELLMGALSYLNCAIHGKNVGMEDWPFDKAYFAEEDDDSEYLKKAGAFIAAELDRRNITKKGGE